MEESSGLAFTDEPLGGSKQLKTPAHPAAAPGATARPRRWTIAGAEVVVCLLAASAPLALARSIRINPLDRIGQVSGLAAIELRYAVLAMLVVGVVVAATRVRSSATSAVVSSLAFAAVAGLAGGLIGSGVMVALSGTDWPLNANAGDAGRLTEWASALSGGHASAAESVPEEYPPIPLRAITALSQLVGSDTAEGLKILQILVTSSFGAFAYLSWRLLLRPPWAAGIGVVAALPLIDPYKPYTNLVLVVLIPIIVKFMKSLRGAAAIPRGNIVFLGPVLGWAAGILFLIYPGWFLWSAPGTLIVLLVVFPWRNGALRALALLGLTALAFLSVTNTYLFTMFDRAGDTKDRYFFFDTYIRPAYIAMARGDLPGDPAIWPPVGEMAGVGLFSILLVIGLGTAVALGGRETVVLTLAGCLLSAWFMRFWLASRMFETNAVQLYPRTTSQILHCLLLLCGFAAYFGWSILRARSAGSGPRPELIRRRADGARFDGSWPRQREAGNRHLGLLCALLLFVAFAGSAVADSYMPSNDDSRGYLAYISHMIRQPDGSCPVFSTPDRCADTVHELQERHPRATDSEAPW